MATTPRQSVLALWSDPTAAAGTGDTRRSLLVPPKRTPTIWSQGVLFPLGQKDDFSQKMRVHFIPPQLFEAEGTIKFFAVVRVRPRKRIWTNSCRTKPLQRLTAGQTE